jgi:hypothetical protein
MKRVLVDETDHLSVSGVILIVTVIVFLALLIVPLAILFIGGR